MDEIVRSALLRLEHSLVDVDHKLTDTVLHVLGPLPEGLDPYRDQTEFAEALSRICYPHRWHEEYPELNLLYFYQALHQLTRERGGTRAAAKSIRRDLQSGRLRAVFLMENGERLDIAPGRWLKSAQLWWSGEEMIVSEPSQQPSRGLVYIIMPDPERQEVGTVRKRDELRERERNTARKLILGMAMGGYAYKPDVRSNVVPEIAKDLAIRGLSVSDDTIRNWLKDAVEEVYDRERDETLKPN